MIEIAAIYLVNMVATVRQSHLMYVLPLQFIEVAVRFYGFCAEANIYGNSNVNADVSERGFMQSDIKSIEMR